MGGKSGSEVAYQPDNTPQFDFASMMGAMGGMNVPSGPSAEELNAQAEEREEERRVTQGLNDRDSLYSEYLDAGGAATDYINNLITDERSNADLLGIDYNITDEEKQGRIDNYFASIWGEGSQTSLESSFSEFGDPEGFDGFLYNRGDSEEAASGPEETNQTVSEGQQPSQSGTTILTESSLLAEEDETSILGG